MAQPEGGVVAFLGFESPPPFVNYSVHTHLLEEVGNEVALTHNHMTLECSLEEFWGVAFSVSGAQPVMAMKSALFVLTCVVADSVLECFAKVKAEIVMIQ